MITVESPWPHRDSSGESPVWSPADQSLIRVDNDRGLVHWLDTDTGDQVSINLGGALGFVVPATTGEVVVSVGQGLVAIRKTGERRELGGGLHPAFGDPFRLNDGKVDSRGRLFGGTINPELDGGGGGLYRFDSDRRGVRVIQDATISNGLDWDDGRGRMYWIDSHEKRIDQFEYDVSTGELGDRWPFAEIDHGDGLPDGMTVDAEGGIWVVLFGAARCVDTIRMDPSVPRSTCRRAARRPSPSVAPTSRRPS